MDSRVTENRVMQSLFYHKIKFAIDKAQKLCYNETDNI